jgi:hypothetical protein
MSSISNGKLTILLLRFPFSQVNDENPVSGPVHLLKAAGDAFMPLIA